MFEEYLSPEVVYVITTNGYVKNNGQAVMGRGTALIAATIAPKLPTILGDLLISYGNKPYLLPGNFVTLPVKHKWDEKADPVLIGKSLDILMDMWDLYGFGKRQVYIPRPGCGNGQLAWETVKPMMEYYFGGEPHAALNNVTVWSL